MCCVWTVGSTDAHRLQRMHDRPFSLRCAWCDHRSSKTIDSFRIQRGPQRESMGWEQPAGFSRLVALRIRSSVRRASPACFVAESVFASVPSPLTTHKRRRLGSRWTSESTGHCIVFVVANVGKDGQPQGTEWGGQQDVSWKPNRVRGRIPVGLQTQQPDAHRHRSQSNSGHRQPKNSTRSKHDTCRLDLHALESGRTERDLSDNRPEQNRNTVVSFRSRSIQRFVFGRDDQNKARWNNTRRTFVARYCFCHCRLCLGSCATVTVTRCTVGTVRKNPNKTKHQSKERFGSTHSRKLYRTILFTVTGVSCCRPTHPSTVVGLRSTKAQESKFFCAREAAAAARACSHLQPATPVAERVDLQPHKTKCHHVERYQRRETTVRCRCGVAQITVS